MAHLRLEWSVNIALVFAEHSVPGSDIPLAVRAMEQAIRLEHNELHQLRPQSNWHAIDVTVYGFRLAVLYECPVHGNRHKGRILLVQRH
jgi:hypothetical protein